jgi:hypothetical protein
MKSFIQENEHSRRKKNPARNRKWADGGKNKSENGR